MKCLLLHYGNYGSFQIGSEMEKICVADRVRPWGITGKILQLERLTQSEDMRRRYHFLSHISLTTMIQDRRCQPFFPCLRVNISLYQGLVLQAAHDSRLVSKVDNSPENGLRNASTISLANVASRAKPAEGPSVTKTKEVGKKGKKPSQVLLSTERY